MHPVMAALHLVGEGLFGDGQGIGVRHFKHRRDAAMTAPARTGFQVLLVGEARLAKMHLRVYYARQDMQAGAVDDFGRRGLSKSADCCNAAIGKADCRARPSPS